MALSEVTKRRLEVQGYNPSDDPELARALPWSRFAYAGCHPRCGGVKANGAT